MIFPPRLQLEGGPDVRAWRLDDGLCCFTEDAAVQLHRKRRSFITSGSPLLCNGRHLTVVQDKMSAHYVATSHFYHDNYFRRFHLVYNLRLLLVTFCLWFVVVDVATRPQKNFPNNLNPLRTFGTHMYHDC